MVSQVTLGPRDSLDSLVARGLKDLQDLLVSLGMPEILEQLVQQGHQGRGVLQGPKGVKDLLGR